MARVSLTNCFEKVNPNVRFVGQIMPRNDIRANQYRPRGMDSQRGHLRSQYRNTRFFHNSRYNRDVNPHVEEFAPPNHHEFAANTMTDVSDFVGRFGCYGIERPGLTRRPKRGKYRVLFETASETRPVE